MAALWIAVVFAYVVLVGVVVISGGRRMFHLHHH